jgi:hypothetical protein
MNIREIVKKRFGYEPGDEKYSDMVQKISNNPNYGLKKETVSVSTPRSKKSKTKYSGLGGSALQDELSRREMFGANQSGKVDMKSVFSKAFGI